MSIRPRRSLLNPELRRPSALSSIPRDLNLLWLDKNENLDPTLLAISNEILAQIPPLELATYPESGELYRKLGKWVGVTPDSLLLTPGSDGAIRLAFEAFVEHADSVIHTNPTFAMYPVYSKMFGAETNPLDYERTEHGPYLDPSSIVAAVQKQKPKLLCLPNPDSPTGTILKSEELRKILTACEEAGTVFLVDEAYHPFYESSVASWTENSKNLIVARTFAKAWGAAGLRIGYAVAHPETIILLHKMRPMYEVSTIAVAFMSRMLDKSDEMVKSVARNIEGKSFFQEEMCSLGFKVLTTYGNFLHVNFGEQGKKIHAYLSDKVLYRVSFDNPCLKGYSRFSIAPKAIMYNVVDLIKQSIGN